MSPNPAEDTRNLVSNPAFERTTEPGDPAGWSTGAGARPSTAAQLTGTRSLLLARTDEGTEKFVAARQDGIEVDPGRTYSLQFAVRGDRRAIDMLAVSIEGHGAEGPAWCKSFVDCSSAEEWERVEILFRAQKQFNPLDAIDLELRLYQRAPGRTLDGDHRVWIDEVSVTPVSDDHRSRLPVDGPWLTVSDRGSIRYTDLDFGLGSGLVAAPDTLTVYRGETSLEAVGSLRNLETAEQYCYDPRCRRLYLAAEPDEMVRVEFEPDVDDSAGGLLSMPADDRPSVAAGGVDRGTIPLTVKEPSGIDRTAWPVTQGIPLPRGAVRDTENVRVLGPDGSAVPAQVDATNYWEDGSVRWVLLDFQLDIGANQELECDLEYGSEIDRAPVTEPVSVSETESRIEVDTNEIAFTVSKESFEPLRDLRLHDEAVFDGSPTLSATDAAGTEYTTAGESPYIATVEENGPMRAVVAVRGWHTDENGERFLTYTTRLHVFRNSGLVRLFHTVTNRHDDNDTVTYEWGEGSTEYPAREVADVSLSLPLGDVEGSTWRTADDDREYAGELGTDDVSHRQISHTEGVLTQGDRTTETGRYTGVLTLDTGASVVTAAVYNYARLFPKGFDLTSEGLAVGFAPFGTDDPHDLLQGTATTTECWLCFGTDASAGFETGRACTEPLDVSSPAWYSESEGVLGEAFRPAGSDQTEVYDRTIERCIGSMADPTPVPDEMYDCGLRNYGDTILAETTSNDETRALESGSPDWTNLEYDVDLGLYIQFARSGRRQAIRYGYDASRHFLDSDMLWHSGDEFTHGHGLKHDVAHYGVQEPGGHSYTAGLVYYYLLSGDRRGLEAARSIADCVYRSQYFEQRVKKTLPRTHDFERPTRLLHNLSGHTVRFANNREHSCPARHALVAYQMLGDPRYLETSLVGAELISSTPKAQINRYGSGMHYRWPFTVQKLYEMTGRDEFREFLIDRGQWVIENPYGDYGEYRIAQSYNGFPTKVLNNARTLFLTSGLRYSDDAGKHRDWLANMYDGLMEYLEDLPEERFTGKLFGKIACNPARAHTEIMPSRLLRVSHEPARFELLDPAEEVWTVEITNTAGAPVSGEVDLGPLPAGVEMPTEHEFTLEPGERTRLEIPITVTPDIDHGRTVVPYRVRSRTEDRDRTREGFFAVLSLDPSRTSDPELLFRASLDDAGPAEVAAGSAETQTKYFPYVTTGLLEPSRDAEDDAHSEGRVSFESGVEGAALGPETCSSLYWDARDNIRGEAGTVSVWMKVHRDGKSKDLLSVPGPGSKFVALELDNTYTVSGTNEPLPVDLEVGEWYHIALTWTLSEITPYVNGTPGESVERERLDVPVGRMVLKPNDLVAFDEFRVYSAALDRAAIEDLYRRHEP